MEVFQCEATVLKETEKAIFVDIDGEEFWIPKSAIDEESDVKVEGDEGTLIIKRHLARAKGLL